ncbi:hypothetical protein ES703_40331 [subsurface metagenome]
MKSSNIIFYLLSHFVATFINFSLLLGTLVTLIVIAYVFGSDPPGGPGFLLPMLMFCVLYTIFFCAAVIFISVAFQIVYHWKKYPRWLPIILVFPIVLTIFIQDASARVESLVAWLMLSVMTSLDFCIYWLLLLASETIINWIRKSIYAESQAITSIKS